MTVQALHPPRPVPGRVAALVRAREDAATVAAAVAALRAVPGVDVVVVVDDGSRDDTAALAAAAGARVVRHRRPRGPAAALETGAGAVALWEQREDAGQRRVPRALLLVDADLGAGAAAAAPLVALVLSGAVDLAVAVPSRQGADGSTESSAEGPGDGRRAAGLARRATAAATGWTPSAPLSRVRCLTRDALDAARPLARGGAVEAALAVDLLAAGRRVQEVPCALPPPAAAAGWRSRVQRAGRYRDLAVAMGVRRLRGRRARRSGGGSTGGSTGSPTGSTTRSR